MRIVSLVLACALCCAGLLFSKTKEFSASAFYSPLPFDERFECPKLMEKSEEEALLAQPFTYLSSGAQMVAFLGEDQKTVLKLFKMKRLLPKTWLFYTPCPASYRHRKTALHEKRREELFSSVQLAAAHLPQETALLAVHLNSASSGQVILVDKKKKRHLLDLSKTPFVLQRRAELIYPRLRRHLGACDEEAYRRDQEAICDLVRRRCLKGVIDRDLGVGGNFGFCGNQAVQIDIGELTCGDRDAEVEVSRILDKIEERVKRPG